MNTPKIVVYVDGGIVQWISHNIPDLEIAILDGDIEGGDEENIHSIEFSDGIKDVYAYEGDPGLFDPEYTESLIKQIPQNGN